MRVYQRLMGLAAPGWVCPRAETSRQVRRARVAIPSIHQVRECVLAERDFVLVLQDVVLYGLAVDRYAVHAAQILDRGHVADGFDPTMMAADVARFELHLIVGSPADR